MGCCYQNNDSFWLSACPLLHLEKMLIRGRVCLQKLSRDTWSNHVKHLLPSQETLTDFFFQDETLVAQKKGCFSAFYSMLENLRENTRIGQLYVTELVSSFHQVAPFSLSLKSWNFLLSQCQDKKSFQAWSMHEVILICLSKFAKHQKILSRSPFCVNALLGYGWEWFNLQC